MEEKIIDLYKDIVSGKLSDANEKLGKILESKSSDRIKHILKSMEDM